MGKNLIVSVESRKGGVGKTTAALVLAKIYKDKGYNVLYLDLDITGTNVTKAIHSVFWDKDDYHIVKWITKGGKEETLIKEADTMHIFNEYFMKGQTNIVFEINELKDKTLSYDLRCIGVIGSEMYESKSHAKPSILFDEIHSYWFIEYLKQIYISFCGLNQEKSVGSALILDNSPGYAGYVSKLHEWLTDLGPDLGKFLVVSSLDSQDVSACMSHVEEIYAMFEKKRKIAGYMLETEGLNRLQKEDLAFYFKLQESKYNAEEDDEYNYYRNPDSISKIKSWDTYAGLIFNKVPVGIVDKLITYNMYDVLKDKDSNNVFYAKILKESIKENFLSKRMIPYNKALNYLFLSNYSSINKHYVIQRRFEEMATRINISITKAHECPQYLKRKLETPQDMMTAIKYNIQKNNEFQSEINDYLSYMEGNKLLHFAELFKYKWQPKGMFVNMEERLNNSVFLKEINISQNNLNYYEEDKYRIIEKILNVLFKDTSTGVNNNYYYTYCQLLVSMMVAAYHMCERLGWNNSNELAEILRPLLKIEMIILYKKKEISIQRCLVEMIRKEYNALLPNDDVGNSDTLKRNRDLFGEISKAQARIIDLIDDYEFLLATIKYVLGPKKDKMLILPYIENALDDVIINKTYAHEVGRQGIYEISKTQEYLRDFRKTVMRQIGAGGWL